MLVRLERYNFAVKAIGPATPHPQYQNCQPKWELCRDVADGNSAVKARGTRYLPKLSTKQKMADYEAYKMRAHLYPAMSRTIQALAGCVFRRKPVSSNIPTPMEPDLMNIDRMGGSIDDLAARAINELLTTGRCAIALDAKDGNVFWRFYKAEKALSWLTMDMKLQRAVFCDTVEEPDPKLPWVVHEMDSLRAIRLAEGMAEWVFFDAKGKETATMPLTVGEDALDYIPVVFFNCDGLRADVSKPPLLDLADTNISQYRTSADLENAAHWTASPTPVISSAKEIPGDMMIGSSAAWKLDEKGQAKFLEHTGAGMESLIEIQADKIEQMAALGARLISEASQEVETAEATRIKTAGDTATLASVVSAVDDGFTRLLRWHADWSRNPGEPTYSLNRDFFDARLSATDIAELIKLVQADLISQETFYEALQGGEWVNPNRDFDAEQALIDASRETRPSPEGMEQPPEEE